MTDQVKLTPGAYHNWKLALDGKAWRDSYEVPLYTDAQIVGEIREGYGPYRLYNTVSPVGRTPSFNPRLVLRVYIHSDHYRHPPLPDMSSTRDETYHGGGLEDEICALICLSLGVRIRAGHITRMFDPDGDPSGLPRYLGQEPELPRTGQDPHIPRLVAKHNISDSDLLGYLPLLDEADAIALIKSARLYQDAVLMSDSDPSLSWILFVSAVETAANRWRGEQEDPIERMQASTPEVLAILQENLDEGIVKTIAQHLATYMGATSKFIGFILEHKLTPPQDRPPEAGRFEYSGTSLRKAMSLVYNYRSRALHSGRPFPLPMCESPGTLGDSNVHSEIPLGLATHAMGATWVHKDTPLMLHTFEHIVRVSLRNWVTRLQECAEKAALA